MFAYNKYLKYKIKYLELSNKLKNNQIGGAKCSICKCDPCEKDCPFEKINNIKNDTIKIEEVMKGDKKKEVNLVVIPGFSESSYNQNYGSLFKYYDEKLNPKDFKNIIMIKFHNDIIRNLHISFFKDGKIINEELENKLYEKCANIISELLSKYLNDNDNIIILAKSAGGGVGIYLSQIIPKKIHKLYLFAPGVKYINNDKNLNLDEKKITVGWNLYDTKVKINDVWNNNLQKLLPNTKVITFDNNNKDTYKEKDKDIDTQHEINSRFIKEINI